MKIEFSKVSFFIVFFIISIILSAVLFLLRKSPIGSGIVVFIELIFFVGFFLYSGLKMKESGLDISKIAIFSAISSGITAFIIEIINFVISKIYVEQTIKSVTHKLPYNSYIIIVLVSIIIAIIFDILCSILFSYIGTKLYKDNQNKTDI